MEHLCIGSYIRIMTSCAIQAERKFDSFCEKILLSLCEEGATDFSYTASDGYEVTYTYTNFGKIHLASQNLPSEVMQMALNKDARAVERYFKREIIPSLEEGKKKIAVLALKNVILKDKNIADTAQIGTVGIYTKNELRSKTDFILSEFLTDVFLYAVTKTDNLLEIEFTKSIKKEYYKPYEPMADTIRLYENTKPNSVISIPLTSKGKFDRVFAPVSSEVLHISATHDLQIFSLKFDDFDFDYEGLYKYLRNNIGYYVYSRVQVKKYMEDEEIGALAYDAIAHIKKAIENGKVSTGNELGELLLYVFLEQVLKAPKLMSRVEIDNHGGFMASKSAGIHLLSMNASFPLNQIVLGTSMIDGDIQSAIDKAFSEAKNLAKRKKDERQFVESTIFAASFPKELHEQLEKIILPPESDEKKPATAFGLFLGYTLKGVEQNGKSVADYQKAVEEQLKIDIQVNAPYIEEKIKSYGLDGYSVYIYILPFRDAEEDKKNIVDKLLQTGGGTL